MIYTVGDSHAWHAWLNIKGVTTKTIGPMTMYSFGIKPPDVLIGIPDGSIVCFCWGEIDCRCHVHKHPPAKECIDELVKNYILAIEKNIEKKSLKDVWIYNVVPPPRLKNVAGQNPSFPFLGTDEDRLFNVQYMNKLLKESRFPVVDIYDKCSDKDGFLNMKMSDGHVHISDEKPIIEWIENKLGEKL